MTDDAELLRRYAENQEEAAFAEIVRRHVDLVHAVTLRKVGGDAHLAQDIVQLVFADLARKAASLARHPSLTGWLFTSAHYAATQAVRSEQRRRDREEKAHAMKQLNEPEPDANWESLRPLLDDVVQELNERERTVILWRFFEGRAFGEIGERLRLTEEGARSRVERALEKMRQMLARRGVSSTGAALGLALANQVSAAPAGLAANVAAAVAGGGAVGGLAGGASVLGFMSTLKLGGSGAVALVVLTLSLGTNAWLWSRSREARAAAQTTSEPALPPALSPAPVLSPKLVQDADLATLRDRMRADGASDEAIRAVLEGILLRRYREQLSRNRAARLSRGWWRDPARTNGTTEDSQQLIGDSRLMHEMIAKPLEALLGVSPAALAITEARYAFLPEETRRALGRLDREEVGGFFSTGEPEVDAKIRADFFEARRRREEERKALLAALAPEQRTEYEMRFGELGRGLVGQLDLVGATEQEFRAIYPLASAYAEKVAANQKSDDMVKRWPEIDREMVDRLIATLGYDRALDYIWAGTGNYYPAYARIAREASLASSTAAHVVQLAAETGERAAAIHADPTLAPEQKRDALQALQGAVRPQLDALLPSALQQRLAPGSLAWYAALAEGKYQVITTILPGLVRMVGGGGSSFSVSEPKQASFHEHPIVPRRPAAK